MTDESDPKENRLVPAGNKALTTRSSALVRRGLEALAQRQPRIVRFPPDSSLGQYIIFNSDINLSLATVEEWFDNAKGLEFIGEARGSLTLQPGQVLCLKVDGLDSKDISSFSGLNPNDVHVLLLDSPCCRDRDLVFLKHLTGLKGLRLSRNITITNAGLAYIGELVGLYELQLAGVGISDEGLKNLTSLSKLRDLSLMYTRVTGDGLKDLKSLSKLESLALDLTNTFNDVGLKYLQYLTKLQSVFLSETGISDGGLKYLQSLSNLRLLSLSNTKVGDEGLMYLEKLCDLYGLILRGTNISDNGLKYLQNLSRLKKLDLRDTNVSEQGLDQIKRALPTCKFNGE
jgi:Leucine Rich repeat